VVGRSGPGALALWLWAPRGHTAHPGGDRRLDAGARRSRGVRDPGSTLS
jgi:hypothetical protein